MRRLPTLAIVVAGVVLVLGLGVFWFSWGQKAISSSGAPSAGEPMAMAGENSTIQVELTVLLARVRLHNYGELSGGERAVRQWKQVAALFEGKKFRLDDWPEALSVATKQHYGPNRTFAWLCVFPQVFDATSTYLPQRAARIRARLTRLPAHAAGNWKEAFATIRPELASKWEEAFPTNAYPPKYAEQGGGVTQTTMLAMLAVAGSAPSLSGDPGLTRGKVFALIADQDQLFDDIDDYKEVEAAKLRTRLKSVPWDAVKAIALAIEPKIMESEGVSFLEGVLAFEVTQVESVFDHDRFQPDAFRKVLDELKKMSLTGTAVAESPMKEPVQDAPKKTPSTPKAVAESPAKEPVRPAAEVIAAWEMAGFKFGWMSVDQWGDRAWQPGKEKPVAGAVPAFHFTVFPTGKLKALPPPEVPIGLFLAGREVTDAGLKELVAIEPLQALGLSDTQVTGAGLKELAGLKHLQRLGLYNTKAAGAGLKNLAVAGEILGLKELAGLKQLRTLDLSFTGVSDAGLKELAGLKQLQTLNLLLTQVTDAGLKELAALEQLQTLNLGFDKVTDAGLKELAGLKQLQTLSLRGTEVTNVGLKELAGLTQLRALNLRETKVTDAGLKELVRLAQLHTLNLELTKVTDAGLKALAALTQLQTLSVPATSQQTGAKLLREFKRLQRASGVIRKWTSNTGKASVMAELVKIEGDTVQLKIADTGKLAELPIKRLSDADRQFIESLQPGVVGSGTTSRIVAAYQWKSPDSALGIRSDGVTIKALMERGHQVGFSVSKAPGGAGKVGYSGGGSKAIVDTPDSRDIHIEIDPIGSSNFYAGLTFTQPCVLEIRKDGTLLANQEGLVAKDRQGRSWKSHNVRTAVEGDIIAFFIQQPQVVEKKAANGPNWPGMAGALSGAMEVRVKNPNDFQVKVGLRSGGKGKDFTVGANKAQSVSVPNGRYDIYFQYSTDPDGLYQGDSFTLNDSGVEIQIVKVVNGNYGIKKIK